MKLTVLFAVINLSQSLTQNRKTTYVIVILTIPQLYYELLNMEPQGILS